MTSSVIKKTAAPIDALTLASLLIACESVTPNEGGAITCCDDHLRGLGFTTWRLPSGPVDNLFARIGDTGPHLCFSGHTDVVPPGPLDQWTSPPFSPTIRNGKLFGRGASDMKGSVAAFIAATSIYLVDKPDFAGSISVAITGDEEGPNIDGTIKIIEWMKRNDQKPDLVLVGEPSNAERMGQTLRIGRRGSYNAVLTVTGKQGHAAYPDRADNAAEKIIPLLTALNMSVLDAGNAHFPKSQIVITSIDVGNPASNIIPGRASARFNIRFNNLWTRDSLDQKIRAALDSTGIAYDLRVECNAESFITEPSRYTRMMTDAIESVSGHKPVYDTGGGTSDARFFAPHFPVVEYGPINETIHQIDEHIALDDLETLTRTYVAMLRRFFEGSGS